MILASLTERAARLSGVDAADLRGRSREKPVASTRAAIFRAARASGKSLSEIGRYFCRDHTTVMYGVRRSKQLETSDPDHAELVVELLAFSRRVGRPVFRSSRTRQFTSTRSNQ